MICDLNCDLGELDDLALEARLMEQITSANIACGGHAGDEATMERTMRLALALGVHVGAHPGYPDRADFGRIEMAMSQAEIEDTVARQIARLYAVATRLGATIDHVKPHGALYNRAARDRAVAHAIGTAVRRTLAGRSVCPTLVGLARSAMLDEWREMGLRVAAEGFADRRYEADGTLRSRRLAGALIVDPEKAAAQAVRLVRAGGIDTICVHGDTPAAADILQACRTALQSGR